MALSIIIVGQFIFTWCIIKYQVKKKGTESVIEVDNPNRVKPKTLKARDLDVSNLISSHFFCKSEIYVYRIITLNFCLFFPFARLVKPLNSQGVKGMLLLPNTRLSSLSFNSYCYCYCLSLNFVERS